MIGKAAPGKGGAGGKGGGTPEERAGQDGGDSLDGRGRGGAGGRVLEHQAANAGSGGQGGAGNYHEQRLVDALRQLIHEARSRRQPLVMQVVVDQDGNVQDLQIQEWKP